MGTSRSFFAIIHPQTSKISMQHSNHPTHQSSIFYLFETQASPTTPLCWLLQGWPIHCANVPSWLVVDCSHCPRRICFLSPGGSSSRPSLEKGGWKGYFPIGFWLIFRSYVVKLRGGIGGWQEMNVYTNTFLGTYIYIYIYISPPKGTFEDQIPFLPGGTG